ncbi:peptidoglycan-binding protein [uncultured Ruminococcus sp.]|uniref:peptidoglycan-binding protein n=1 Tax=uncultured Ruminococcus sp. TaxID=165186 RepID=UPI00292F4267|nr:peptidoglycan-binding protein [uncultured Ruminococcus sp.]
MKTFKKIISLLMVAAVIATICVVSTVSSGASGTGAGLAEWALKAYNEGWSYVWGGDTPGAVDCSGMITSYCGGNRTSMLSDAQEHGRDWGYVSSGIPRVHGLGLSRPGHVGVYIADGMEVDARGSAYGVCYQQIGENGYNNWDCWFKLTAVSYPENGWESFNGDSYYYENGEYIVNTSRTIDGVTYYFDSTGRSDTTPSSTASSSSSSSSSSSKKTESNGPLQKGSTGSKVEKLQERLAELGYYTGEIDGDFGENTEKAFKLFQKTIGLYVDGIAGSDTDYLYADDAPAYVKEEKKAETKTETAETETEPETTEIAEDKADLAETGAIIEPTEAEFKMALGDYSDDIALVQARLIELGYLSGTADGEFGSATEEAVKSFQTANGLEASGIIDQDAYDLIFSDGAVKNTVPETEDTDAQTTAVGSTAVAATPNTPKEANQGLTASKSAGTTANNAAPANTGAAPNTEVEKKTTELSSKGVAAVTDSPLFKRGDNATNFQFIIWLVIMIAVMLIAFTVVYAIEKKKQQTGRRFQA